MRIRWSPAATALARRYLQDQDDMRAIGVAVGALADDPHPPEGFHRGRPVFGRVPVGDLDVVDPFHHRAVGDLVDLLHVADVQVAGQVLAREQVVALDTLLGDGGGVESEPDLRGGQQHVLVRDVSARSGSQAGRVTWLSGFEAVTYSTNHLAE